MRADQIKDVLADHRGDAATSGVSHFLERRDSVGMQLDHQAWASAYSLFFFDLHCEGLSQRAEVRAVLASMVPIEIVLRYRVDPDTPDKPKRVMYLSRPLWMQQEALQFAREHGYDVRFIGQRDDYLPHDPALSLYERARLVLRVAKAMRAAPTAPRFWVKPRRDLCRAWVKFRRLTREQALGGLRESHVGTAVQWARSVGLKRDHAFFYDAARRR